MEITEVVRKWELPLEPEKEDAAIERINNIAKASGFSLQDFGILLDEQTSKWLDENKIGRELRRCIDSALEYTPPVLNMLNSQIYFKVFKKLQSGRSDNRGLSPSIARRLLSRSSLITHLLQEQKFSCSQVARFLSNSEVSINISTSAIAVVAREFGLSPNLDEDLAGQQLWSQDQERSAVLFPDSSLCETNQITAAKIRDWIPEEPVEIYLFDLSRHSFDGADPNWPYLQILHWCLLPVEFYDHPVSYLYEFSPRGKLAAELFARYGAATGNPVLNNAKATQKINEMWAITRGGEASYALVRILKVVESLPFVPRRQVARIIRAWLIRLKELHAVEPDFVHRVTDTRLIEKMTEYIARNETNTRGVIEQRVVDYLSDLAFSGNGWRPHGLGDGVNASNLSRRKLGDLEFLNVDKREAIALEAHGGGLTKTYILDHQKSLNRIIDLRLRESWAMLDDPSAWSVKVIFVAHDWDESDFPSTEMVHGVQVSYQYISYQTLKDMAWREADQNILVSKFEELVVQPLNSVTVRESVRTKFREILDTAPTV